MSGDWKIINYSDTQHPQRDITLQQSWRLYWKMKMTPDKSTFAYFVTFSATSIGYATRPRMPLN